MKKFIISICCLIGTILFAQEKSNTIKEEGKLPNWGILLSKLDTTQIKSGVLIDKVVSFSNLVVFNTEKHNTSSKDHFIQALSELHRAANKKQFPAVDSLKAIIKTNTFKNQVLIGIINANFEKLNWNDSKEGAKNVTFNKEFFEPVEGKPTFLSRKVLVASPLSKSVMGTNVDFKFSEVLLYANATSKIRTLTISFGDGTEPTLVIADGKVVTQTRTARYEKAGEKTLQFDAVFEDESRMMTHAILEVLDTNGIADLCNDPLKNKGVYEAKAEEAFQGYNEAFPIKGQIEYETFYHTKDKTTLADNYEKKMVNPIIIVDGFDPGDKRKVQDCDCQNDPKCFDENKKFTFPNGYVFTPDTHSSIEESMFYDDNTIDPITHLPRKGNVLNELRNLGYDVIVINNPTYEVVDQIHPTHQVLITNPFPHYETRTNYITIDGGADYIERNGRTLASFIKEFVKTEQYNAGSNENLVFIGPSMGGQITRYALTYMEKKFADTGDINWKHNAKLWVSVDSPHLGASVPVGAQANIWFLGYLLGKQEAKDKYNAIINSAAAKQMTISQFQNALDTHTYGYAGGGNLNNSYYFDTYYNTINSSGVAGSNGYPVTVPGQFRKIAIANGSLTGVKKGTEGQKFLDVRAYININPFALVTGGLVGAALLTDFFDSIFGSSNNIEINMLRVKDYFEPAYGSGGTVFEGSGFNTSNLSYPGYTLSVNNNDMRGSLDVVPSGFLKSTISEIKNGMVDGARAAFLATESSSLIENSFMPSFTALAHLQPNQDWSNPLNYNLACPSSKQTPFDSYYGAATNTEHVSFTKESVAWLKKELAGTPQAPSYPVDANDLSGPETICLDNTTVSYSFGDVCKIPSPATFTVSDNLEIVGTPSATEVTVRGTANGEGTITVHFQDSDQTVVKKVWVGLPSFNNFSFVSNAIGAVCFMGQYTCTSPQINFNDKIKANFSGLTHAEAMNNANWEWQTMPNDPQLIAEPYVSNLLCGSRDTRYVSPSGSGNSGLQVKVQNACGWSDWQNFTFSVTTNFDFNKSAQNLFRIFPNPTSDVVNVMLADENKLPVNTSTITAELFDMMEQSKGSVSVLNNTASINVAALPKGIYVLKIYIDGTVEYHQVAVQ